MYHSGEQSDEGSIFECADRKKIFAPRWLFNPNFLLTQVNRLTVKTITTKKVKKLLAHVGEMENINS